MRDEFVFIVVWAFKRVRARAEADESRGRRVDKHLEYVVNRIQHSKNTKHDVSHSTRGV